MNLSDFSEDFERKRILREAQTEKRFLEWISRMILVTVSFVLLAHIYTHLSPQQRMWLNSRMEYQMDRLHSLSTGLTLSLNPSPTHSESTITVTEE